MADTTHLPTLLNRLHRDRPGARYELDWGNPVQLLVATILAAQCTDERVNRVTPALFARYRDAAAFAAADQDELEELVRPTGFYRNKAKAIKNACRALVDRYGGQVPRAMDDMLTLLGVARKTANVVLTTAYQLASGIIVDTHVARVSQRLGLTDRDQPDRIEEDLMAVVPEDEWTFFGPALVLHGRYVCTAHAPHCPACTLNDLCPKIGVTETGDGTEAEGTEEEEERPMAKKQPANKPAAKAKSVSSPHASAGHGASGGHGEFDLPPSWQAAVGDELSKPYFKELQEFIAEERTTHTIFPPPEDVFNAFWLTPFDEVKVLLLGQDPYPTVRHAHGLCFSVLPGVRTPASLVNMFKELHADLGCTVPNNGYLAPWAEQGVLLLNAVLTVREGEPNSHANKGWEKFTDAVIRALNDRAEPVAFALWGGYAQKKGKLIDGARHRILTAAHPSPLSVKKYMGSRPFSKINEALGELGKTPIDWQLADI